MLSGEILTSFTNEIRGGSTYTAYMQNGRSWADRRLRALSNLGGGGDEGSCPSRNKKKLSEEILIYFTYILLMKLGGGIGIHAKWKGVGGQARVQGRGGEEALPPPPPLEIGIKDAVSFHWFPMKSEYFFFLSPKQKHLYKPSLLLSMIPSRQEHHR